MVGLGNPGEKFSKTRHNTGFLFLDYLVWRFKGNDFKREKKFEAETTLINEMMLLKPQTFMNTSGESVRKVLNFYKKKFDRLVLIYDDLDIEFGKFKIEEKGPRVHNGVNSVMRSCLEEFLHVRIGTMGEDYYMIKKTGGSMADDYILKDFNKEEKKNLEVVFERVWERLERVINNKKKD